MEARGSSGAGRPRPRLLCRGQPDGPPPATADAARPATAIGHKPLGRARPVAYHTAGTLQNRIRMPTRRHGSSADTHAMVAEVSPAILALLADGVPRSRHAILAALAGRHPRDDVRRTLMRLAVTEQLVETGGKYTLPPPGPEQS
jgi:hypothetical protein